MTPRIISLDVETYGLFEHSLAGKPLPPQTVFEPRRMLATDGVHVDDVVQTCAITLPRSDSCEGSTFDCRSLSALEPGSTFVLRLGEPGHLLCLYRWLAWADAIIGFNLPFDISVLRLLPLLRPALSGRHTLIDCAYVRSIYCEVMPEKRLKDLGPALALYEYTQAELAKHRRYKSPHVDDAILYNARDSHRTLHATGELARLTLRDFPATDKLSPHCIAEGSDAIWTCIRMMEAGDPISLPKARALHRGSLTKALAARDTCARLGLDLEAEGSDKRKRDFLNRCFDLADAHSTAPRLLGVPSVRLHELYQQTDKTKKVSITDQNRSLARALLAHVDPTSPDGLEARGMMDILDAWGEYVTHYGVHSKFTAPLLYRKLSKTSKNPFDSLALAPRGFTKVPGLSSHIRLSHSLWYPTKGDFKDGEGGEGGQQQCRLSARLPSRQQWPPSMQEVVESRFGADGAVITSDLSQIELRTAALLSGDASLVQNYIDDLDLHTDRAVAIFGPDIIHDPDFKCGDMTRDPRQWGKKFNFADLYLSGPGTMQAALFKDSGRVFPISFFLEIVQSRPELRPGLLEWHKTLFADVNRDGYLVLPFTGHGRTFIGGMSVNKPNEVVNFPVHTVAALTMRSIQRYLHRNLPPLSSLNPPAYLFANVHDAVKIDCRKAFVPEALALLRNAVTHCAQREYWSWWQDRTGRTVPLKYEVKVNNRKVAA